MNKIKSLIESYTIALLSEMRGRQRRRFGGGRPNVTNKPSTTSNKTQNAITEYTHKPIILSILDDMADWDEAGETYTAVKDFLAFERKSSDGISFQRRYVNERFFDLNDLQGLDIYNKSRRGKEKVNIGKDQSPFDIPIVYVLASDVVENSEGLGRKSFQRRYSGQEGYMYTSTLTREKVRKAFKHLGLAAVGIDIVNIDNAEDIHNKFVKQFNRLRWNDSLRELGYTPGVSEEEASRIINQNKGVRRDREEQSVNKRDDLLGVMASSNPRTYYLHMNKQEFDDMISQFARNISSDDVAFTFGFVIKDWTNWADITEAEFENIVNLSMNEDYEDCMSEIRKFMARGYENFIDSQITKKPEISSIKIRKNIEVDERGYPTNLTDEELTNYYGSLYRYVNFAELVLPAIIAKSKKPKPKKSFGMSSPPVPEWALRGTTAFDRAFVKSWRQNYRRG